MIKLFTQKIVIKLSKIYGFGIRDPRSGIRNKTYSGSRNPIQGIPDPDLQHCFFTYAGTYLFYDILYYLHEAYFSCIKFNFQATAKSEQDSDPNRAALVLFPESGLAMRKKDGSGSALKPNADPKHCLRDIENIGTHFPMMHVRQSIRG
jgi:hypothetical protein